MLDGGEGSGLFDDRIPQPCVEELVAQGKSMRAGVHPVRDEIDAEVGRLKLAALGVEIDEPTSEQVRYRGAFAPGARKV